MAFKLPTLRDIPRLPSFDFDDIKNEISIAKGGYGFVYKATYKKNSCHKKIASESSKDENLNVHTIKTSCWVSTVFGIEMRLTMTAMRFHTNFLKSSFPIAYL